MQRRSHNASNGNGVMMTESSTVVEMGGATTTTVQQQQQQRRRRRKKVVRNSGFRTHYRREWEAMLQVSLVVGWFVVALVYCIYHVSSNWALYSPTVHVTGLFGRKMVYNIPHMMSNIGDKSVGYQLLRQEIDALLPENDQRSLDFVESIKKRVYKPIPIPTNDSSSSYNVLNCPDQPPPGYPYAWNILDLLEHWPANDYKNPRSTIHMGVCRFDYRRDYDKIMTYRQQEVPFVVSGDPEVARTVERWNTDGYMQRLMSDVPHRCEYSPNNQFMYWIRPPGMRKRNQGKTNSITTNNNNKKNRKSILAGIEKPENWKEPTTMMRMRFGEWLEKANVTDDKLGPEQPHWYYRLIGCGLLGRCDKGSSEYLYDELTFFQPQEGKIYLIEPRKQKGIHCRFGMKGVTAENHFDGSRNSIVVLGGERRYILSHPDQCPKLALYPKEHPSGRHSAVDWSDPDLVTFPEFAEARSNELVLQAGDVLYLPTNWFHHIISLDLNYQCNARSGINPEYQVPISRCGF